ncbi:PREDICTED: uncharacterized protein LOC109219567 [Nicotiana attenuata]|uniref:uncharacterized protein LOC109219567 n=1 Tax=Nicotiana attenuata TaxID=49451 RepID=UPI000905A18D|nr:PREDICTED: uncharacterized protein LOC109219567 [Nicotiana attenuata]
MRQHGDNAAVVEYGQRVEELALRTLHRAREGAKLDHEAEYAAPEEHHRGRPVPRGRGRARARAVPRGRGAPRGRGGRRGGGPQQGGVEAPVDPPVEAPDEDLGDDQPGYLPQLDEPSSSMPSYNLQLDLPASQVTPSYPLSITGIFDGDVDQFFSGTSTAAEDRTTRDVDGGCRLSYASSPAVDADLPQAQVADGPTTPSTNPASCTIDTAAHPHIKRRLDDDDPDSVPGR